MQDNKAAEISFIGRSPNDVAGVKIRINFVLQIMSQVEPGGNEGICCRTVIDRPYWNWRVLAHDYLVVSYYSVYAFVSR